MSKTSEHEAIIARLIELIQAERLRQKLSLNEVATRAGLSHTMVMRVEKRERVPTIDTLLRIAHALQIDLGSMLKRAIGSVKRSGGAPKH